MRLFCLAEVQTAHSSPLRAKQTWPVGLSVTWGDAGNRIRKHTFLDEGSISLLANCIQADMWFQPVSRMQPGWPALSAQHIRGNRPYLMWHGWHHLESCEETLPMINSSSENMERVGSVFTPADVSPKLRTTPWHDTGPCKKAESSAVNNVDVKTSRGQTEECESREVTQHYNCLSSRCSI